MPMNIHAVHGDKVRVTGDSQYYADQREYLEAWGVEIGRVYTVDHMEPKSDYTSVYLVEIPGIPFNSGNFVDVT